MLTIFIRRICGKTIVFFTSDNGPHQEGNHKVDFFNSNGPLRGSKRSMHEGGIRVPMIVRWPGVIAAGGESDLPTAAWDFLPTACELATVELTADVAAAIDGVSIVPTLRGRPDEQKRHEYLYWASGEGATSVGVRRGPWKLVRYRADAKNKTPDTDDRAAWRLYNRSTDIGETDDVAANHPAVVEEMLQLLRRDGLL